MGIHSSMDGVCASVCQCECDMSQLWIMADCWHGGIEICCIDTQCAAGRWNSASNQNKYPQQWTGCGEGVRIICGTWFGVLCGYALNMARHEINSAGRYPKPPDNCITSQNNNSDEVWV